MRRIRESTETALLPAESLDLTIELLRCWVWGVGGFKVYGFGGARANKFWRAHRAVAASILWLCFRLSMTCGFRVWGDLRYLFSVIWPHTVANRKSRL